MKKIVFTFLLSVAGLTSMAHDEFYQAKQDEGFAQLERVEIFVNQNHGITLEELKTQNSELIQGIELEDSNLSSIQMVAGDMPLVGSFWWGCCLGVIGLALVYFITDNDKAQVKSALWGCLIATLLWGAGGLWNPFGWF